MSETELKLVADDLALSLETLSPFRSAAAGRRERIESWYFDTPDQAIRSAGWSLRLRRAGGTIVQTVKQDLGSVTERGEWESLLGDVAPPSDERSLVALIDFATLDKTGLGTLAGARAGDLRVAFKVAVERTVILLESPTATVEAAIDRGAVSVDDESRSLDLIELELELKSGDRAQLFAFARALVGEAPLSLSLTSKSERGYRLAGGAPTAPARASEPILGASGRRREAFEAICRAGLHDFLLNAELLAGLYGPLSQRRAVEAVHQGRIALRRLRAALALFRPILRDEGYSRFNAELRRMASLFGAARDRDVLQDRSGREDQWTASEEARAFAAWLEARRLSQRETLTAALQSGSWRLFLLDFCAWLDGGAWRGSSRARRRDMPDFVRKRLRKRRKALVRQGRELRHLAPDERHKVRIAAKKLRYMGEFFRACPAIADVDSLKSDLKQLEAIQGALGELHDDEERALAAADDLRRWLEETGRAGAGNVGPPAPPTDVEDRLRETEKAFAKLARSNPFQLSWTPKML